MEVKRVYANGSVERAESKKKVRKESTFNLLACVLCVKDFSPRKGESKTENSLVLARATSLVSSGWLSYLGHRRHALMHRVRHSPLQVQMPGSFMSSTHGHAVTPGIPVPVQVPPFSSSSQPYRGQNCRYTLAQIPAIIGEQDIILPS